LIQDTQISLFLQYFQIKISLYCLDSQEAIDNRDLNRLLNLEKRMTSLSDMTVKVCKGKISNKERSTAVDIYKTIINAFLPSLEINKNERRRKKVFTNNIIVFRTRDCARDHIVVFMKNVESYIERLEDAAELENRGFSNKKNYLQCSTLSAICEKIDMCKVIKQEMESILANAKLQHAAPIDFHALLSKDHDQQITIQGLRPMYYLSFVRLKLEMFELNLKDINSFGRATPGRAVRTQKLTMERDQFIKDVWTNINGFGAGDNDEDRSAIKDIKALVGQCSISKVGADETNIVLDTIIQDLPTITPNTAVLHQREKSSNSPTPSISQVNPVLTFVAMVEESLIEYDKEKKKIFPDQLGDTMPSQKSASRLGHLINSIPLHHFDELEQEITSTVKKLTQLASTDEHVKTEQYRILTQVQQLHIDLSKIILLFKLTKTILDLDYVLLADLNLWYESLPVTTLIQLPAICTSLSQTNALFGLHNQWVNNIQIDLEETTHVNVSSTRVLLDLESDDSDRIASEALVIKNNAQLFIRYYAIKSYLYALDGHEAAALHDISRLELIEKKVTIFNSLMKKVLQSLDTIEEVPTNKAVVEVSDPKADKKRLWESLTQEKYYQNSTFRNMSRKNAIIHLDLILKDLNGLINQIKEVLCGLKKKDMADSIMLTLKIESVQEVVTALKDIQVRANYAAPVDSSSYLLSTSEVISPHGLIINVENKNALAWGQVVAEGKIRQHYVKPVNIGEEKSDVDSDTEEKGLEEEKRKWRPIISHEYPYQTVRTLNVTKSLFDDSNNCPIFGLFHNLVKKANKPTTSKIDDETKVGEHTEIKVETDAVRFVKATATHVAFYRICEEHSEKRPIDICANDLSTMVGNPFLLRNSMDHTEIDLKTMIGSSLLKLMADNDDVSDDDNNEDGTAQSDSNETLAELDLYLVFMASAADKKKHTGKGEIDLDVIPKLTIVEDSPLLHLHVHRVHDGFDWNANYEDDDEYGDYDDDDDDDDSDEDDDGNGSDESSWHRYFRESVQTEEAQEDYHQTSNDDGDDTDSNDDTDDNENSFQM
jgi:Asp-tRNA(Asn)/Glu-tRNA(Gln) amidotransferase C subunit